MRLLPLSPNSEGIFVAVRYASIWALSLALIALPGALAQNTTWQGSAVAVWGDPASWSTCAVHSVTDTNSFSATALPARFLRISVSR